MQAAMCERGILTVRLTAVFQNIYGHQRRSPSKEIVCIAFMMFIPRDCQRGDAANPTRIGKDSRVRKGKRNGD